MPCRGNPIRSPERIPLDDLPDPSGTTDATRLYCVEETWRQGCSLHTPGGRDAARRMILAWADAAARPDVTPETVERIGRAIEPDKNPDGFRRGAVYVRGSARLQEQLQTPQDGVLALGVLGEPRRSSREAAGSSTDGRRTYGRPITSTAPSGGDRPRRDRGRQAGFLRARIDRTISRMVRRDDAAGQPPALGSTNETRVRFSKRERGRFHHPNAKLTGPAIERRLEEADRTDAFEYVSIGSPPGVLHRRLAKENRLRKALCRGRRTDCKRQDSVEGGELHDPTGCP